MNTLALKINPRDLKSKDPKWTLNVIMSQWLPLSTTVLLSVIELIPTPREAQAKKFELLFKDVDPFLKQHILDCDPSPGAPVIAYVSKMFSVEKDAMPGKKRIQLTAEQMRERKALMMAAQGQPSSAEHGTVLDSISSPNKDASETLEEDETLVGFARIYSGTLKAGQEVYVLSPKYDPTYPDLHCTAVTVKRLFLMMGRDLEDLESVPAGNVFAISGLEGAILKSGTLSSSQLCPSLAMTEGDDAPIVRVALEATDPSKFIIPILIFESPNTPTHEWAEAS